MAEDHAVDCVPVFIQFGNSHIEYRLSDRAGTKKNNVIQITAPYFVAGIEVDEDQKVIEAAPIIKYMLGWDYYDVIQFCERNKWRINRID